MPKGKRSHLFEICRDGFLYEVFAESEENAGLWVNVRTFARGERQQGIRRILQYVEGFEYPQLVEEAHYIRNRRYAAEANLRYSERSIRDTTAEDAAFQQRMIELRAKMENDRERRLAWHRERGHTKLVLNLPIESLDF